MNSTAQIGIDSILESHIPLLQSLPKLRVIASQDNDEIGPSFRKHLTGMPIKDDTAFGNKWFEFIEQLVDYVRREWEWSKTR